MVWLCDSMSGTHTFVLLPGHSQCGLNFSQHLHQGCDRRMAHVLVKSGHIVDSPCSNTQLEFLVGLDGIDLSFFLVQVDEASHPHRWQHECHRWSHRPESRSMQVGVQTAKDNLQQALNVNLVLERSLHMEYAHGCQSTHEDPCHLRHSSGL